MGRDSRKTNFSLHKTWWAGEVGLDLSPMAGNGNNAGNSVSMRIGIVLSSYVRSIYGSEHHRVIVLFFLLDERVLTVEEIVVGLEGSGISKWLGCRCQKRHQSGHTGDRPAP